MTFRDLKNIYYSILLNCRLWHGLLQWLQKALYKSLYTKGWEKHIDDQFGDVYGKHAHLVKKRQPTGLNWTTCSLNLKWVGRVCVQPWTVVCIWSWLCCSSADSLYIHFNMELLAAEDKPVKWLIWEGIAYCCNQDILMCKGHHWTQLFTWAGKLVLTDEQRFWSVRDEQRTSQHNNSVLIIGYFMHTEAPNVLSPATNMSIQRWYNKTTRGWCGSHYSTNELSPWQSDLSANEASRPCAGGSMAQGQPGDGLRRGAGVQHLTLGRAR